MVKDFKEEKKVTVTAAVQHNTSNASGGAIISSGEKMSADK